jgi:hypothetical protein
MISLIEQEAYIKKYGWSTWYNPKYWVNPKIIQDPKTQDYTNYGMDLNSAYCFEKLNLPKLIPCFMPRISQIQHAIENKNAIEKLLRKLEKS